MSESYHSLLVVLDHDVHEEDAQKLINAINMMRWVADVTGETASGESQMAEARARHVLGRKLIEVIYP